VDNYAAGFLAAGASAVIAEASDPPTYFVRAILTLNASLDGIWRDSPTFHGHVTSFASSRARGAIGRTDPVRTGEDYDRSIVGWPATQTATVRREPVTCAGTLQSRINATPTGGTLDLAGCGYSAGAIVRRSMTIVGATIRPPAGTRALTVAADDVTLDGLRILGPQATAFGSDEMGVYARGSAAAPVRELVVRNCEIGSFGGYGIYLQNVADVRLEDNQVHDIVYAGLMVLSGQGGRIENNTVQRIGVVGSAQNDGNAYGIALTAGAGGAAPTADFAVTGNTVEDVPTWHALDTHGGQRIAFSANTVRRSMRGIFITAADGARPSQITVSGNTLDSPAPVSANLLAVTTYDAVDVTVTGNTATGWGIDRFFHDYNGLSTGLVVSDNTVTP
jgi:parallel beta-helix repeat protein